MIKRRRGRNSKYPWKAWFKSRRFTLYREVDYRVPSYSIAQQVRNHAGLLGLRIEVHVQEDSVAVTVKGKLRGEERRLP